jgi:hypothetical protein
MSAHVHNSDCFFFVTENRWLCGEDGKQLAGNSKLTAEEARNLCQPPTSEQVFDDIRSRAKFGGRDLTMRTVLLSAEAREDLTNRGYTIRDNAGINGDLTVIEW